jgi:predicted ATP-dependent endonuclease of OLD family
MRIDHIDIKNFRKLKSCRIDLAKENTIFVGANNSGKTSAMNALMMFLKKSKRKEISTTDFTLSNWAAINKIGKDWATSSNSCAPDLTAELWRPLLPLIDVWIQVEDKQIHYVSHILPTLDWNGELLGIRLVFEPNNPEELYKGFMAAFTAAQDTMSSHQNDGKNDSKVLLSLWPKSMRDFLDKDKELHKYFTINAYLLDPSKCEQAEPQKLPEGVEPLDGDPFDGLFKIDIINAQRGFSDANAGEGSTNTDRRLSSQLRHYFDKHLDPTELPDVSDLEALNTIEAARTAFDEKLKTSFSDAIRELEGLNYPGFSNPQILLSSKVNPLEGLNHDSAVQFKVVRDDESAYDDLCLPEKYNGLGYQNLISMIFSLIRFRDEWMRVGKAGKRDSIDSSSIEPLHLVLIEEPEAHLHAQVQQVFIKKAYDVLRNHPDLKDKQFSTQMVVSTHSSHLAHETQFTSLRYFRRQHLEKPEDVPCVTVVNMTTTFGDDTDTGRFADRYLRTTHCDLFFADAVILVEGPAERILVPHFIRYHYPELDKSCISLLEIGGSHAHRLQPLIEALGLLTLVITDLDSIGSDTSKKVLPEKGKNYRTGNDTLKKWVPCKESLDEILHVSSTDKVTADGQVRVAFPSVTAVSYPGGNPELVIPYTFEDALVLGNLTLFRGLTGQTGLIKKMVGAVNKPLLNDACQTMFEALDNGKKAEMALDLLYTTEPFQLPPPQYIAEGLKWLEKKLAREFIQPSGAESTEDAQPIEAESTEHIRECMQPV